MNIEQASRAYLHRSGKVKNRFRLKLRAYHELDRELLAQVQEALDFAIEIITRESR